MKRAIILSLLLCLLFVGCASKPSTGDTRSFTFTVTHSDGETKEFSVTTEQTTLAGALQQEGLIHESADSPGLYDEIDGEIADWNDGEAWWCISRGGVPLTTGMQDTEVTDGDAFEAVFTRGYGE